tara:strand:- start:54 stop:554 length:501 start_codon:yes stop_codon:yes gene_type:complete
MPNYQNGFIYKLCCKDVNIKEIYVGSTTNMKSRKTEHKRSCNTITRPAYNNKKYQYIRENGGWINWSMIWIKDFPCNSKKELEAEEDKIMRELNATLNTYNSKESPEKLKANRQKHSKNALLLKKKWYHNNKHKQITCECGSTISIFSKGGHLKSKKHQSFISSNN